jgi:transcription antitermination factor NusG
MTDGFDTPFPWYALRVKHRHEKAVSSSLEAKGYETFVPRYRGRERLFAKRRDVEIPLFPGYVFCRMNVQDRLPVLITPGIFHIVRLGRFFAPVDESEIHSLQIVIASDLYARPWPFLKGGQHVFIEEGPLRGLTGNLADVEDPITLIISVTLLQRSVAVEIDREWVHPITSARGDFAVGTR